LTAAWPFKRGVQGVSLYGNPNWTQVFSRLVRFNSRAGKSPY